MSTLDPKILIRGIVSWMRMERVPPTRTRLVKFLYLADLHYARYHEGITATNWRWTVDKFGPLSVDGFRAIDDGVKQGWLLMPPSAPVDDPETGRAIFYDVLRDERQAAIEAIPPIFGRVRKWIQQYGDDLPSLLRFVYGNTEPMENASEGDRLDFSVARPVGPTKPIESLPMKTKDVKRFKDALRRLSERYERESATCGYFPDGPQDDAYYQDLPKDEPCKHGGYAIVRFRKKGS